MNAIEVLVPAVLVLTWALGLQVAIWWPHQAPAESARARAYGAMRYATAGILLGYVTMMTIIITLHAYDEFLPFVLTAIAYGSLLQTPLALVALAIERRERVLTIIGSLVALIFAAGWAWYSFLLALTLFVNGLPFHSALAFLALVLAGGAVASVMELYVAVRQPRERWDASQPDLL